MKRRSGLKIMVSLIGLLGKLAYIIIFAVFGGILGNSCAIGVMVLGATCVAKIIDPSVISCSLNLLIALTIIAGILRGGLRFLEQYNNHYIAFKLLASLRDKIFGALRKLAPAKLEGEQKGSIIAMLTSDVETLEVFYAHTISPILIAIFVDGGMCIFIGCVTNIYLALIALCAYLIIGIAIPFISSAILKKDGMAYRQKFSETSSYFLDSIKGIKDIVIHNNSSERSAELSKQSADMNKATKSIKEKSSLVGSISNLTVSLFIMISMIVGIICINNGSVNLAHLIIGLVALFSSFGPVLSLANLPTNLTQTFASGDRILNFMEEAPEVVENTEGQDFDFNHLTVKDVSFGYQDNKVLNHIFLTINKGDIVSLTGESGCGKSTLLKLMLRFYDVKEGSICYNDINLKDIKASSLKKNVVMVSQDTYLFDDTILNNLIFVNPKASLDEVREACRKASIDDFIMTLPKGYDTEVGLLGDMLSAGEKQRLGLARAFLSGAEVILLDEVTSNVDAMNEGIILKSLKKEAKNKTIVLVSHRASTVAICNKNYRIEKGCIQ